MVPEPLIWLAGRPITPYHIIYALGFLPALALSLRLAWERGYRLGTVLDYWFVAVVAALGGGRLVANTMQRFVPGIPDTWSFGQFLSVAVVFGIARRLVPRARRMPPDAIDLAFPSVALYLGIARIGCFAAGCCHGRPAWGLPWAVSFTSPSSDALYVGIPLHPTQLYESAGAFALLALLLVARRRSWWRGRLAWLFFIGYGLLRFAVEFYRGDVRTMVGPVSMNQIVALSMAILGGGGLAWSAWRHRLRRTTEWEGAAPVPLPDV